MRADVVRGAGETSERARISAASARLGCIDSRRLVYMCQLRNARRALLAYDLLLPLRRVALLLPLLSSARRFRCSRASPPVAAAVSLAPGVRRCIDRVESLDKSELERKQSRTEEQQRSGREERRSSRASSAKGLTSSDADTRSKETASADDFRALGSCR